MKIIKIETPLTKEKTKRLKAGSQVLLSGTIYTARDMAHARLVNLLQKGKKLPFEIVGSVIYYVGPAPTKPGRVIGSAGPTTSYRMDPFTPLLLDSGLKGVIGKGPRSKEVVKSLKKNCGIYFGAIGGAAALISQSIIECKIIAFEDLGTEAVRELRIKDMPLIVINDSFGGDLYIENQKKYSKTK